MKNKSILNEVIDGIRNNDHDKADTAFKTYLTEKTKKILNVGDNE